MRTIIKVLINNMILFLDGYKIKSLFNYIPAKLSVDGKSNRVINSKIVGRLIIESNVKINDCFFSGNISINRFTSINGPNTTIISSDRGKVTIGSFCSIARGVQIQEFNHVFNRATSYFIGQNIFNLPRTKDISSKGDIIIEDDVWIGANSIILSGVKLGRGSIIAAGTVVSKNVEPYSIVAGVPAKLIKKRFNDSTIEKLEKSKWWKWSLDEIKKNQEFFFQDYN